MYVYEVRSTYCKVIIIVIIIISSSNILVAGSRADATAAATAAALPPLTPIAVYLYFQKEHSKARHNPMTRTKTNNKKPLQLRVTVR